MCGCLSHAPYWGPGMCPNWEMNWQPFSSQPALNPLSYTSQGCFYILKDVVQNLYNFLPKFLEEFTMWAWYFLFWKVINYCFNLFNRHKIIQIFCFFLIVFGYIVCFKEFVHSAKCSYLLA